MDPEIPLSQAEEERSPARVRKTLGAAFDPSEKFDSILQPLLKRLLWEFFAQNRSQEFCGKYVFGVPLGEGSGVVCFSCVAPDLSFATPSPSVGNWLAGCRSHAPRMSDTVAINTKYFFIKVSNLSHTNQSLSCGEAASQAFTSFELRFFETEGYR